MKQHTLASSVFKAFSLVISLFVLTGFATVNSRVPAISESTPCVSEPTDMTVEFGDAITCAIDIVGDSDLFRFDGGRGEAIIAQVRWTSGAMRPCIELIAPDNSRLEACENSLTNRIDATLAQTGVYTILVDVLGGVGTGEYVLALERLIEPSPNAQAIQYGDLSEGQLYPDGELDLFFFDGEAGETVLTQVAWHDGTFRPCIQLVAPDNSRVQACENSFTNRIDTTLNQAGTYAILVEDLAIGTGDYALVLERLLSPSPSAQELHFGHVVTSEFDPVGDLDLYTFEGTADDLILLTISWLDGTMRPCLQLISPDNSREIACDNAFSNQIDVTLGQTGTHAVLADVLAGGTGAYTLGLQCITGNCLPAYDDHIFLPTVLRE